MCSNTTMCVFYAMQKHGLIQHILYAKQSLEFFNNLLSIKISKPYVDEINFAAL